MLTTPSYQAVFTDTPGFHKPRTLLGQRLNRRVEDAVADVDAVVMVVDAAAGVGRGDAFVAQHEVAPAKAPKLCVVNKIDRLRGRQVVPQLAAAAELTEFDHVLPASARTGQGVAELRQLIAGCLPEGPPLFPEEVATDQPLDTRISEIVREKALALTREELPHSVAVMVEEMERDEETGFVRIDAIVYVERESQKGIVIGKGGSMLKEIGTRARQELEVLLEGKVHLDLRVKVLKEWQRDESLLDRLRL